MIKCIIFDCDGTLVDSEYLCNLGFEIKLREDYCIESSAIDMVQRFRGRKLADILNILEQEHQIKLTDDFTDTYRSLVNTLFEQHLKPCEGVNEMLQAIKLDKCVASSGPPEKIKRALSVTGLLKHFNHCIYSSYTIQSWKPEPELFLYAAQEMGVKPHECLVVEDSPPGIAAANAAGMASVLYDPSEIYNSIKSSYTIKQMRELVEIIL